MLLLNKSRGGHLLSLRHHKKTNIENNKQSTNPQSLIMMLISLSLNTYLTQINEFNPVFLIERHAYHSIMANGPGQ